jgi:hypothetical protein
MTRLWGPLLGAVALVLAGAPEPPRDGLCCDEPLIEAGQVRSGSRLAQRFTFVNRGREPAEVTDVRPSCGCLTPRLEPRRYGPGEAGVLLLEVNTLTAPPGPNHWRVEVFYRAGGEARELTLQVHAEVVTEIRVEPAALVLCSEGAIAHDVTLTDTRPAPLAVTGVRASSPHLRARCDEPRRDAEGRWARTVRVEVLADHPEGRHEESVLIATADPAYPELRIPVTVVRRPKHGVTATPEAVTLSAAPGQPLPSRVVRLRGPEDADVEVVGVESDSPAVRCQWAKGPGPMATLRVQVDPAGLADGGLTSAVRVRLSRPRAEVVTIPVTAVVR